MDGSWVSNVSKANSIVRHVQLKATFLGSTVKRFPVNIALSQKPSGCVVILLFEKDTLNFGSFRWLGGSPGKPLPDIASLKVGKHSKANAQGVKNERPRIRNVSWGKFEPIPTIGELAIKLFGSEVKAAK